MNEIELELLQLEDLLEDLESDKLLRDSETKKGQPMNIDAIVTAGKAFETEFMDERNFASFRSRGSMFFGLKESDTLRAWELSGLKGRAMEEPNPLEYQKTIDAALSRVQSEEPSLFDPSKSIDPLTGKPRFHADIIENDDPRMQSSKYQMENQEAMQRSAKAKLRRMGK